MPLTYTKGAMRFKQYWKNKVDESLSRYENPEYLQQLKRDYVREDRQKKISANAPVLKIRRFAMAAFCLVAMSIAIFGGVYLAEGSGISNDKTYLQANEESITSNITDINESLMNISVSDLHYKRVLLVYDKLYSDNLYYMLINENSLEYYSIITVVNANYNYEFETSQKELTVRQFLTYELEYYQSKVNLGELFEIITVAKFDTGAEKVYITYNELSLDGNSNFLDFISTVFTAK